MTNASFKIKLLTLSLLALSGCSSLPQSDTSPEKAKEIMAAETVKTEVPKKTIAPETLYDLLIAEMGGKSLKEGDILRPNVERRQRVRRSKKHRKERECLQRPREGATRLSRKVRLLGTLGRCTPPCLSCLPRRDP